MERSNQLISSRSSCISICWHHSSNAAGERPESGVDLALSEVRRAEHQNLNQYPLPAEVAARSPAASHPSSARRGKRRFVSMSSRMRTMAATWDEPCGDPLLHFLQDPLLCAVASSAHMRSCSTECITCAGGIGLMSRKSG